jgi:hypothetical protein
VASVGTGSSAGISNWSGDCDAFIGEYLDVE